MGPSVVRYAGLQAQLEALGHHVLDLDNVSYSGVERLEEQDLRASYAEAIVEVAGEVDRAVTSALRQGAIPVVVGGDHSLSLGSVAAVVRHRPGTGLLWLDAHGDFNTGDHAAWQRAWEGAGVPGERGPREPGTGRWV